MLRPLKNAFSTDSRAGISLDGARAAVARVDRAAGGRHALCARVVDDVGDTGDWPERTVAAMDLSRVPVSAVLGSGAYQLQLVETPNVPEDELEDAIRWRLQHLIDFPVDEAVVQVFEMPAHANAASPPHAYAVVSPREDIVAEIERLRRAELDTDVIDIPELCIRNVAIHLPQDEYGVAFLHFTADCGYLTITRQGVLYLLRRIETSREDVTATADDTFARQELVAGLALEVQRSLDYYESHYDNQPITSLVLGPGAGLDEIAAALGEQLGIGAQQLDLAELFDLEAPLDAVDQGHCLVAAGAALREDPSGGKPQ